MKRHIQGQSHKEMEEVKKHRIYQEQDSNLSTMFCATEGCMNTMFMKEHTLKKDDQNKFMRERQPKFEDELHMCTGWNCFLSNRTYCKHECSSIHADAMAPFLMATKDVH